MAGRPSVNNVQDLRDYKQIELSLVTDLEKLRELAQKRGHAASEQELAAALQRLHSGHFTLAVVGEFKRGKSTLINALLGQDIFPADVLPTTATLNRLVYSLEKSVDLHYHDGRLERIPLERLNDYVTKLDEEAAARAAQIREAVVYYPCQYCRNHVELVDTPGLQDEAAMTAVTMSVLPEVDAAIMVISALSPLSESEFNFLEQLGYGQCARVFIVVSSIDRVESPEQLQRLLAGLQRRLERMDDGVRENLHPQLFPVSAYQALQGRVQNNAELLRASRMEDFERALATFLTEERGAAALLVPLQITSGVVNSLRQHLQARVQDWQRRDQELQQARQQVEPPAPAPAFTIEPLLRWLAQEPSWKTPLRQLMETVAQELPGLLFPAEKGSLFAALKSNLDSKRREQIAREIFERIGRALEEGLVHYERELLFSLDRLLDDFLDLFPEAMAPADGLRRNRDWVTGLLRSLRERLNVRFEGGFSSWAQRPELWVRLPQKPPVMEIRRDLESELIRQLGIDLSACYREWVERIEVALRPPPPPQEDRSEALRQWVRQQVLLEKEQADLRADWALLQTVEDRLNPLRERLLATRRR